MEQLIKFNGADEPPTESGTRGGVIPPSLGMLAVTVTGRVLGDMVVGDVAVVGVVVVGAISQTLVLL